MAKAEDSRPRGCGSCHGTQNCLRKSSPGIVACSVIPKMGQWSLRPISFIVKDKMNAKFRFEKKVVPQNIEFKLIKSEFIDDDFIELPIISNA